MNLDFLRNLSTSMNSRTYGNETFGDHLLRLLMMPLNPSTEHWRPTCNSYRQHPQREPRSAIQSTELKASACPARCWPHMFVDFASIISKIRRANNTGSAKRQAWLAWVTTSWKSIQRELLLMLEERRSKQQSSKAVVAVRRLPITMGDAFFFVTIEVLQISTTEFEKIFS